MRKLMLVAVGVVAACAPAAAQTAPAAPAASPGVVRVIRVPNAMHAQGAAFSLNGAYREIGRAEQAGATGHLVEAARTHYRGAMARYGKNDGAGAAAEARLATDLARAALDERPRPAPPTPRDLPAPPALPAMPGMADGGGPGMPAMPRMPMAGGGPEMMMRTIHIDGFGGSGPSRGFNMSFSHGGFDAMRLAEAMKIESGSEAKQLAQAAVDANAAAQRAALAGNVAEVERQTRLSGDLMSALEALVALNHPDQHRPVMLRAGEMPGIPPMPAPQ